MYEKKENVFYYITTMNENYPHPEIPKDNKCEEGILKGMYKIKEFNEFKKTKIQSVNLSSRRLRSESAAIVSIANVNQIMEN